MKCPKMGEPSYVSIALWETSRDGKPCPVSVLTQITPRKMRGGGFALHNSPHSSPGRAPRLQISTTSRSPGMAGFPSLSFTAMGPLRWCTQVRSMCFMSSAESSSLICPPVQSMVCVIDRNEHCIDISLWERSLPHLSVARRSAEQGMVQLALG